jgi:hypothetical protein
MSETPVILLGFERAIDAVLEGQHITREEWNDKRTYGLLQDHLLYLHKAGEAKNTLHPWILSDGDLTADDWYVL